MAELVFAMFGFGYLMVPLYNSLCRTLGINGKTGGPAAKQQFHVDTKRNIRLQFITTIATPEIKKFYPLQRTMNFHPGAMKRVAFFIENPTNHTIVLQAIPSVSPGVAAKYLKKTECFCFTRQKMKAHLGMDWPILFHIEKDLPKNIHTITLAYTLFDLTNSPIKAKTATNEKTGGHFVIH